MLTCGAQMKAARALIGIDQFALASLTKLNVNTIRAMEASGLEAICGRASNVQTIQRILEDAGLEFLAMAPDGPGPGVRMRGREVSPTFSQKVENLQKIKAHPSKPATDPGQPSMPSETEAR